MRPLSLPRRADVLRLPPHSAQPPPSPPPSTLRRGESTSRSSRGGSVRRIHAPDRATALPDRSISVLLAVDAHVLLKDGRLRAPPPPFPSSLTASHMALRSSRSSAGRVGASAAQVQDHAFSKIDRILRRLPPREEGAQRTRPCPTTSLFCPTMLTPTPLFRHRIPSSPTATPPDPLVLDNDGTEEHQELRIRFRW